MFPSLAALAEFAGPFRRADLGLFGGKTKQYGNNVPFSKHKTRRTWLPNIQRKRLDSEVLGQKVRVKVTTRALRTIKKKGGLDHYLKDTPAHKLSSAGIGLKLKIRDTEDFKKSEYLKSPEGQAETKAQLEARGRGGAALGALAIKVKRVERIATSLEDARAARLKVGKALGLSGPASPEQTFKFLTR